MMRDEPYTKQLRVDVATFELRCDLAKQRSYPLHSGGKGQAHILAPGRREKRLQKIAVRMEAIHQPLAILLLLEERFVRREHACQGSIKHARRVLFSIGIRDPAPSQRRFQLIAARPAGPARLIWQW